MTVAQESSIAVSDAPSFVGEGVVPVEAYQLSPWTPGRFVTVLVCLLLGALLLWIAKTTGQRIAGAALLLLSGVALWTRLYAELRYGRAARAGHPFQERFEIGESGIRFVAKTALGEPFERHYDWFMFENQQAQPHRLLIFLRVPSANNKRMSEVLLLPAALFPQNFADVCAFVAARVSVRPAAPAPQRGPNDWIKTVALWLFLVGLLAAVYFAIGAR